jgi:hypothetical protein
MRRAWVVVLLGLGMACKPSDATKSESVPEQAAQVSAAAGEGKPHAPEASAPEASVPEASAAVPELLVPLGEPVPAGNVASAIDSLPPPPDLTAPVVPDHHPDGAWSIAGLRKDPDARFAEGERGEDIIVRAYVQEIYAPPPCPEAATCAPVKQPHLWAADTIDSRGHKRAMLVIGYAFSIPEWDAEAWKDAKPVVLEVGKQYTFKGKFRQFSDTGFSHEAGLLEFVAVQQVDRETGVTEWVDPPGAPWHPISLARIEAGRLRLEGKARKK